jgi:GNAT superfamily N-acetyltransferase
MIRQAVASDAVKAVPLIMQAIGHIAFVLTGTTDSHEVASILSDFFGQKDNRISYQNALGMEEEGELVGVAIFYCGAKARELDAPLERAAAKKSGNCNYSIPTEPEASEFYLDTLSVSPPCQGKGYGRQLIETGCDRARKMGHHRIALLVEVGCGGQTAVRATRVLHGLYQADRGTGILSHGTEFVMYQGVRAALRSGKRFLVPAFIADVRLNPQNASSSSPRSRYEVRFFVDSELWNTGRVSSSAACGPPYYLRAL